MAALIELDYDPLRVFLSIHVLTNDTADLNVQTFLKLNLIQLPNKHHYNFNLILDNLVDIMRKISFLRYVVIFKQ